jgi:hypothetical protein
VQSVDAVDRYCRHYRGRIGGTVDDDMADVAGRASGLAVVHLQVQILGGRTAVPDCLVELRLGERQRSVDRLRHAIEDPMSDIAGAVGGRVTVTGEDILELIPVGIRGAEQRGGREGLTVMRDSDARL